MIVIARSLAARKNRDLAAVNIRLEAMDRKYTTVRELKVRSSQKSGAAKKPALKKHAKSKKVARDAGTGKFISTGHHWEIIGRTGDRSIVLSTSASSSEAIETIVKKRKRALMRLADK